MQQRILLFIILLTSFPTAYAQQVQVCDGATSLPIRNVTIAVDGKHFGKTDYRGLVRLPDAYETATFSCPKYHPETLTRAEVLKDTVFLFPENRPSRLSSFSSKKNSFQKSFFRDFESYFLN